MKRLSVLVAAIVVAFGVLFSPAGSGKAEADIAAFCANASHLPNNGTYQLYVEKYSADFNNAAWFDGVQGNAKLQDLEICVGGTFGTKTNGGSAVIAANNQNDITGDIDQIGYAKLAGWSSVKFVYVFGDMLPHEWPDANLQYHWGYSYVFKIYRGNSCGSYQGASTWYTINDAYSGYTSQICKAGYHWGNHAWWGAETWDGSSLIGHRAGTVHIDLRYMGYLPNNYNQVVYRSNMIGGPGNSGDVHNNTGDSNRHGHIFTWNYGNDALDIETHT